VLCVSVRTGTQMYTCSAEWNCLLYPAVTEMYCCIGPLYEGCAVREVEEGCAVSGVEEGCAVRRARVCNK
jgi:hypothetical protein